MILNEADRILKEVNASKEQSSDVLTSIDEAFANIVHHGYENRPDGIIDIDAVCRRMSSKCSRLSILIKFLKFTTAQIMQSHVFRNQHKTGNRHDPSQKGAAPLPGPCSQKPSLPNPPWQRLYSGTQIFATPIFTGQTSLSGAALKEAYWNGVDLSRAEMGGTQLDQALFTEVKLNAINSNFSTGRMSGSRI